MKTITLWQPWATLWATGIKKVETRSWSLDRIQLPSRILIHAAARPIKQLELDGICEDLPKSMHAAIDSLKYPTGCIVGICTLQSAERMSRDVIINTSPIERVLGLWDIGRWAWFSSDPILLDSPIPCRGNQLFWTPSREILDLVKSQLEGQGLPVEYILGMECDKQ